MQLFSPTINKVKNMISTRVSEEKSQIGVDKLERSDTPLDQDFPSGRVTDNWTCAHQPLAWKCCRSSFSGRQQFQIEKNIKYNQKWCTFSLKWTHWASWRLVDHQQLVLKELCKEQTWEEQEALEVFKMTPRFRDRMMFSDREQYLQLRFLWLWVGGGALRAAVDDVLRSF